ncbi:GGDEF domain-containing protein [Metabacillus bambusae]|uniref:Diguanylate cyclase n=1 Tax=Metabacillus bambusae TaxID=2795218 RepID=A0ABS3MWP0_9BACI|nr:diguanylate cyclase [Metabacillus bambusae]MBO1510265.1 diguanylate cyclase [Metabacillus bambusae]
MLKDLFVHLCIMIAFLFVGGAIFKNNPYEINLRNKMIFGVFTGILGSLLMIFSIQVETETIIDLRHIVMIVSAIFGGFVSSFITSTLIAISRLLFLDISTGVVIVSIAIVFVGAIMGVISSLKISKSKQWIFMVVTSTFIFSIILYIRVRHLDHFNIILFNYWCLSIFGGIITYILVNYISRSNYLNYEYKKQATVDFLTGLKNARQFDLILSNLMADAKIQRKNIGLLYIDIDYFKQINDRYGHQAGDSILHEVGSILIASISEHDTVFRNGGEEFSVLLLDKNLEKSIEIAEHIRTKIERHPFLLPNNLNIHITFSIGVTTSQSVGETPQNIVKRADDALYRAKSKGRNQVCWSQAEERDSPNRNSHSTKDRYKKLGSTL